MKLIKEIWEDRGKFIFFTVTYGLIVLLLIFRILVAVLPWLNDESAPLVWISGISHKQCCKGSLSLRVVAEDTQTAVAGIHVFVNEELIASRTGDSACVSDTFFLDTDSLPEGIHSIKVKVTDSSLFAHTSERQYEINVDRTPPVLTLMSKITSALQGDTLPLFIQADEALATLQGEVFEKKIIFFPHPLHRDYFRGLIGIHVLQRPQSFVLVVQASDLAGNEVAIKITISVNAKKFHQEQITLTPQKAGLLTDYTAIRNDYKKINAAYSIVSSHQLWQDAFLRPAAGRVSSPFGEQRVFNFTIHSIHRGIDIANKAGTPIHAANYGIVVLAEKLHLYGNTVIIDHGQGVLTMYAHMQKLAVTKNSRVAKGQLIGFMGDTGLTTGAHLHWEMRVNGLAVNPGQWMETAFAYP
jgi:murein DD-endopeptidase MepM/ murein hydrolase activator NlpD